MISEFRMKSEKSAAWNLPKQQKKLLFLEHWSKWSSTELMAADIRDSFYREEELKKLSVATTKSETY